MKPYIKKIGKFNGLSFFYVDGNYIRKNIEKDFSNTAAHHNFKFIPENEIWIDREFSKKEYKYFIKFFLARGKAIKQGKTPEKAKRLGNLAEQKERNKSKLVKELKKLSKEQQIKKIHKKLLQKYSNNKIKTWIVNGFLVRSLYFLDFTEGGHEKVYNFVPRNEIWIDDSLNPREIGTVLLHEIYERRLMQRDKKSKTKQESYLKSHKLALKIENFYKKHPRKLNQIIKQELQKA